MINLIWKRAKPWCIPLGLTLLFYILMRHVFLIGYVPTASMEPTLPQESFIFGSRIFDEPKVGDIIVFEKDGTLLVKRIAAGPGDQVDLSELSYMTSVSIPIWNNLRHLLPSHSEWLQAQWLHSRLHKNDFPFLLECSSLPLHGK